MIELRYVWPEAFSLNVFEGILPILLVHTRTKVHIHLQTFKHTVKVKSFIIYRRFFTRF